MIPKLTAAQVLRALRHDGWTVSRQSGSHVILRHPNKPGRVTVPNHAGLIIKPNTMASILSESGLTGDELRRLV